MWPTPNAISRSGARGSLAFFFSTTHALGISFMYAFIAGWIESRALQVGQVLDHRNLLHTPMSLSY